MTTIAEQLHQRLKSNRDHHAASGDAFVASVYGEWGIGKTRCLKDVEELFRLELEETLKGDLPGDGKISLTVPVFFVPWQYEHEEHLVVPLLKTVEHRLRDLESKLPTHESKTSLRKVAGKIGDYSVALLSAFKFEFAPLQEVLGMKASFEPAKAFEEGNKRFGKKPRPSFARYESLYFDTRQTLKEITDERDGVTFRFVLLIDDLDRCLPEKAIQMLESVKLFLNAPGFAFVLAVDDEVVERGIQHRYRDYHTLDGSRDLPISGAQYLEKIVQLPLQLPRWTKGEAEAFLRGQFPDWFGLPKTDDKIVPSGKDRTQASRHEDLLQLLLRACPLVPRKLIRAAEGLQFTEDRMREYFSTLPPGATWNPHHALRLALIQQLYPPLYRLMRDDPDVYWRLFKTRRDAHGHLVYGEGNHTLATLKTRIDTAAEATDGAGDDYSRTLHKYLHELETAHDQRCGDPLLLVRSAKRAEKSDEPELAPLTLGEFDAFYLHHLPLKERPPLFVHVGQSRPEASIADPGAVLAALFHPDGVQRRRALEELELEGRQLPGAVFRAVCETAKTPEKKAQLADPDWLNDLDALLSPQQLADFYRKTQLLSLLAEETHA